MLRFVALCLLLSACATPDVERWSQAPVSSNQYESHPAFDPRTRDLYFVRSTPEFSGWRIFVSACGRRGQRSAPSSPSFAGADGVEADPFFTRDGSALYFISTRSENGVTQRDLDIWRVARGDDNVWRAPVRLPEPVNSEGAEWFPRLARDGWLYFGSDRPGGHGRTDIYRALPDGVGGWRVQNLGPNINTAGDEYEAEFSDDGLMVLMADGDLYESRLRNGQWSPRVKLDRGVNTEAMEVGPLLSPEGDSLMFARDSGDPSLSGEIYRLARESSWPPRCR
ncbi:MAG: TolB family protein [Caulobacteraceae bacterium]